MSKFDLIPKPSVDEIDLPLQFKPLYIELLADIDENLPGKPYVGNCTKEFCEKIIDLYIDDEFERIQAIEFPSTREKEIDIETCEKEIESLLQKEVKNKNTWNIIKKFHKSIVYASRGNCLSPIDGWKKIKSDKKAFRSFYHNRLRCSDWYKEKKWHNLRWLVQGYVPEFIYGIGLSTSRKYPEVSYFKPGLAKYLILKYLDEFDEIFDPFSGYSGRMLGTIATGKKYIGQDLCVSSVDESKSVYDFVSEYMKEKGYEVRKAVLSVKDSEISHGTYQCLFTCSPYGNIERWPGVPSKGYTCDEWIEICLKNYDCRRYVFVTDEKISKFTEYVKEKIENTSHFGANSELVVVIEKSERDYILNEMLDTK